MRIGNTELQPLTKNLLFINIFLFAATYLVRYKLKIDLNDYLAAYFPLAPNFKPWQLITHMFMHGGLTHLFFNMFGLFMFGNFLERVLGSKKMFILYFVAGFGAIGLNYLAQWYEISKSIDPIEAARLGGNMAYIKQMLAQIQDSVGRPITGVLGASGALYGVMAAFAYLFPNTEMIFLIIPYPIKAKYLVPGIVVLDLILGFNPQFGTGIAHFAHVGGALFGFLTIYYWNKVNRKNFY